MPLTGRRFATAPTRTRPPKRRRRQRLRSGRDRRRSPARRTLRASPPSASRSACRAGSQFVSVASTSRADDAAERAVPRRQPVADVVAHPHARAARRQRGPAARRSRRCRGSTPARRRRAVAPEAGELRRRGQGGRAVQRRQPEPQDGAVGRGESRLSASVPSSSTSDGSNRDAVERADQREQLRLGAAAGQPVDQEADADHATTRPGAILLEERGVALRLGRERELLAHQLAAGLAHAAAQVRVAQAAARGGRPARPRRRAGRGSRSRRRTAPPACRRPRSPRTARRRRTPPARRSAAPR